jgi:hypothetical protein
LGCTSMASGRCLCGTFEYTVDGSLGDVRYCHCGECRRGNGTAFSGETRGRIHAAAPDRRRPLYARAKKRAVVAVARTLLHQLWLKG